MKKILNAISIVGSTFVSFLLFVLIITLGIDVSAKKFLNTTTFSKAVQEMEFQVLFLDEENKETATGKRVYDYFENMGITRGEVNKIIKNNKFKELFGNYFGSILLKNLDKDTKIIYPTKEELYVFVDDNYEFFKKVLKVKENDKDAIKKIIYKEYDYVSSELEEIARELTKEPVKSKYIDIILNPILTWGVIGGITISIILLIILRKSLYKWLMWFYMPAMTAALTLGFISLFANKLIGLIVAESIREYSDLISPLLKNFSVPLLIYSIVLFVLSIIAFIIHFIFKEKN